jgi:hypothetical protein
VGNYFGEAEEENGVLTATDSWQRSRKKGERKKRERRKKSHTDSS